jgi:hypothetical protein
MRVLFAILALLAAPVAAWANQAAYDNTVMAQAGVTYYWPFNANTNTLVGGSMQNGVCTGVCTFGVTLGTNVTGYVPGNTSSGITLNIGVFGSSSTGWSTAFVYKSTNTTNVAFMLGSAAFSPTLETFLVNPSAQCSSPDAEFWLVNPGTTIGCGTTTVSDGNTHVIGSACTISGGGANASCRIVVDGHTQATITLSGGTFDNGTALYTFGGDPYGAGQVVINGGEGELVQANGTVWADSVFLTLYNCAIGMAGACVGSSGGGHLIEE